MLTKPLSETQSHEDVNQIEGQLVDSFQPVIPDPEFIRRLHHRLVDSPSTIVEPKFDSGDLFIILFGILTGFLILLAAKRFVNALLRRLFSIV